MSCFSLGQCCIIMRLPKVFSSQILKASKGDSCMTSLQELFTKQYIKLWNSIVPAKADGKKTAFLYPFKWYCKSAWEFLSLISGITIIITNSFLHLELMLGYRIYLTGKKKSCQTKTLHCQSLFWWHNSKTQTQLITKMYHLRII